MFNQVEKLVIMENTCPACTTQVTEFLCPNCGFKVIDQEASLEDLYHNQLLLIKKLSVVQQQKGEVVAKKKDKKITVFAEAFKPLKIKLSKINLKDSIDKMNMFFQGYLTKDNDSIAKKLTKTTALRLSNQKKILKSVSFFDLKGTLTNLSAQQLIESQRALFHELLEEEKNKISESLKQQVEKIKQNKQSANSKVKDHA